MGTKPQNSPSEGYFEVDAGRPLPGAGGGLDAYVATDRRGSREALMAVRVADGEAPRAEMLASLGRAAIPFCLAPLGHAMARDAQGRFAQFVICAVAPGASLAAGSGGEPLGEPWGESELLETLLRPAAAALAALQAAHATHRAIRLQNLFQIARGQPVTLGCAWAAAPGSRQPAPYEPAYSAACPAWGRDDGVIADDVYALGVAMVALASGAVPMQGLDRLEVVGRKLALGGAAAVIGEARLPPMIADLARGMLAEDPDHRPSPALLADPQAAGSRRVAARPRRRAQRAIEIGDTIAWECRGLAHALACQPNAAVAALRGGAVDQWLRRVLGDASIALVVEEAVRQRASETILSDADADAFMLMRSVAILDPLAPLCWLGLCLWPGALGAALAAATPEHEAALVRMIDTEAPAAWTIARAQRGDPVRAQVQARQWRALLRQRGWAGGVARLRYAAAPLLSCRSAALAGAEVVRAAEVLPALERAAARADRPSLPMDAELAAFVAARLELRMDAEFAVMGQGVASGPELALMQLRVLARLHARHPALLLPLLASWLASACAPLLDRARSRTRQADARVALDQQVATGRLPFVLAILDSPALEEADRVDAEAAEAAMARLDAEIATAQRRLDVSRRDAKRAGREIAASLGMMLAAASVAALLL